MSETIYHRYRLKRRTTAGWAANNEVLLAGEPGIEVLVDGTEKIKYGDGVKTWAQLSYAAGGGGGAALSNATPQALGTAAAGTSAEASRADHRHQMPTAGQVGADASGTAAAAVAAHAAAEDPHPGYALEGAHKATHATGGTDALSPADIGAATAAQGAKADSAVQPAGLTKAAVGLGNADNTSDADKPVSTATATALGGKAGTGAIGSSGLTMATARLLGRTTAGAGAVEEIQVSGGTFANGVLTLSGLPSTVTADASGNLTFTARWIQSTNGAASAPPMSLTGTWFTSGGTAETTKPQFLIEPAGTTSTSWSTAGTGLGVNAASGFGGNLLDLQVGGARQASISNSGILTLRARAAGAYIDFGNGVNIAGAGGGVWLGVSTRLVVAGLSCTAPQSIEAGGPLNVLCNGASNTPPASLTGTWFTGGTPTTTKPQLLIEPAGTTSANWSTAGTGLGVNAASGFTGDLAWFGVGGLNRSKIDASGNFTASTLVASFTQTGVERYVNSAFANFGRQFGMYVEASGNEGGFKADSAFNLKAANAITFVTAVNGGSTLTITSASTGTPRIIGVNGRIEFGTAGHLSIFNGPVVTTSVTVANLPAAATAGTGARSFVTDANATTFLSTVAGGGSNRVPVVSDGTNWLIA